MQTNLSPESKVYHLWNLQKEERTGSTIEGMAREIAVLVKVNQSESGDQLEPELGGAAPSEAHPCPSRLRG